MTGKRGDPAEYEVQSIVLYEDIMDGRVIHRFDVFNNRLVIDGTDYTAEHNGIIAA